MYNQPTERHSFSKEMNTTTLFGKEAWFIPFAMLVSLACIIYIFENVEEEKDGKQIGKGMFGISCLVLSGLAWNFCQLAQDSLLSSVLAFQVVCILIVGGKVIQN